MRYVIKLGKQFERAFRRLYKRYNSLDKDLENLQKELKRNPNLGVSLGHGVRKVRMAISDKGKGKSHGARVITYTAILSVEEGVITLLAIYDKSDRESISSTDINLLLKELD